MFGSRFFERTYQQFLNVRITKVKPMTIPVSPLAKRSFTQMCEVILLSLQSDLFRT